MCEREREKEKSQNETTNKQSAVAFGEKGGVCVCVLVTGLSVCEDHMALVYCRLSSSSSSSS